MATATQTKKTGSGERPVHQVRLGRIAASIWQNETKVGLRYSIVISRIFTDENGDWKRSTSFGRDDLPLVAKVADLAHTWCFEQGAAKAEESQGETAEPEGEIPF